MAKENRKKRAEAPPEKRRTNLDALAPAENQPALVMNHLQALAQSEELLSREYANLNEAMAAIAREAARLLGGASESELAFVQELLASDPEIIAFVTRHMRILEC